MIQRQKALWTHRYYKYSHIFLKYLNFLQTYLSLQLLKLTQLRGKKLIAISLTQQFGDIVAAEPLSRQIREKHPDAYLIWIVKKPFEEIVAHNPAINQTLVDFCAGYRLLLFQSGIFDVVYNLQLRNNSHCETCGIYLDNAEADAQNVTIYNYYSHGNLLTGHQKIAGFPVIDRAPQLYIQDQHRAKVQSLNLPETFVVIHCQSNQPSRDWSTEKWGELLQKFWQLYPEYSVVEVGLQSKLQVKDSRYVNLSGKLSLLETAEVIRKASLFIGIDSGPSHLANAVHTPGVVMIGKLAAFTEHIPYSGGYGNGSRVKLVRNTEGPSADIAVSDVLVAVQHQWNTLLIQQ